MRVGTNGAGLRAALMLPLAALFVWSSLPAHEAPHRQTAERPAATTSLADGETHALLRAFRETGDDRNLDLAWERLTPILERAPNDVTALTQAATVAQARHDFDGALDLLDRALAVRPHHDQAWLLRASILLVRGKPDEALAACRRLRHTAVLAAVTCRARVDVARGDHARALTMLAAVLAGIEPAAADTDLLAWTLSVAGDAAAIADPTQAIDFYRQSLEARESAQVRAALVDRLLAAERLADARTVLDAGHDALPLAVRRLIVAVRMSEADTVAEAIARADHEFRHWIEDRDWAHAREMARFYLDVLHRPGLAQCLAAINLELQQEPEDLLLARRTAPDLTARLSCDTSRLNRRLTY